SGAVLEYADFTDAEFTGVVLTDVSIKDTLCPSGEEMLWNDDLDGVCP
ncbi:MAG: pentapeptide repeat-containing protein, partial [Poseidonia sp.]